MASLYWSCSGHQYVMSGIGPGFLAIFWTLQVYVPQMNTVPQMNKIENSTLEMSTTNLSLGIDNRTKMVQKQ